MIRFLKAFWRTLFGKKGKPPVCEWITIGAFAGCSPEPPTIPCPVKIENTITICEPMPRINFSATFAESGAYTVQLLANGTTPINNISVSVASGSATANGTDLNVSSAGVVVLDINATTLSDGNYKIRISKSGCGAYESGFFAYQSSVCGGAVQYSVANNIATITNGDLRLEVDYNFGAAIRHLSQTSKGIPNVMNIRDAGRWSGISVYAGPANYQIQGGTPSSNPAYSDMSWNAVQAGDDGGNGGEVIFDGSSPSWNQATRTLYVKSRPLQWKFTNRVVDQEVICESWYTFDESSSTVRVRYKMTINRADQTVWNGYPAEVPYLFFTRNLENPYGYLGNAPFSNQPFSTLSYSFNEGAIQTPPYTAGQVLPTERWISLVDGQGKGVGVYVPIQVWPFRFRKVLELSNGTTPTSDATMVLQMIEDRPSIGCCTTFECDFEMILGTTQEVRQLAYARQNP
jgi:hypothetical protein